MQLNLSSITIGKRWLSTIMACVCMLLLGMATATTATAQSTEDCAPTRLEPWAQAQVPDGQGTNRIRNEPSLNGAIMGEIPVLVPVDILEGPTCADGILWWEVEARGERGFTAEVAGDEYFLERINNDCPPSRLVPGGAAFLDELNVRDVDMYRRPRLEAPFEPTATSRRNTLYLTDQSVCAQDTRWWRADAEDGSSGWVIETQQQARNLNPAPRLERDDFGVIIEPVTAPPPAVDGYVLAYINEPPDIPFSVEVPEVFVHALDGEPERISGNNILFRQDVYWSPDGTRIAYEEGEDLVIITLEDMTRQDVELYGARFQGWSPDGDYLVWNDYNETLEVYKWGVIDLQTGDQITLADGDRHALARWVDANTFELMNRTEDGSFAVATVTIDPRTVEAEPLPIWTSQIDNWAFAPDGRIAFEFGDQLALLDRETGTVQTLFNLERVDEYAWSPTGDHIAVIAGFDDIPFVIDVDSRETTPLLPVNGSRIRAREPLRWSHDGVFVVYRQSNQALLVQPADGSAPPTVLVEEYRGGVFPEDIRFRPVGEQ